MTVPDPTKPYKKRLTLAERERGYPPESVPFKVKIDDESFKTTEVIHSLALGPRESHEHYHIHLPKLKEMPKGIIVTVTCVGSDGYELTL